MNISQVEPTIPLSPEIRRNGDPMSPDNRSAENPDSNWGFPKRVRRAAASRAKARQERDIERGYSINVKQVVLAFLVEFVIIGLILTSQYFYALNFANSSQSKTILAFLFPVALAVVELARVPLAIAVRTQNKWYMQFTALIGVACAVVVTSASLYQIGHYTFNPRLENVHIKRAALDKAQQERDAYAGQRDIAQKFLQQKIDEWNSLSETLKALNAKFPTSALSHNCTTTETQSQDTPEGNPPKTTRKTFCNTDPAFKAYQKEAAEIKARLDQVQAAGQQTQAAFAKYDLRPYDENVQKAEADYRDAIYQSQLHSYTGMLFGKDSRDVTEGEVKTLEWYLILIPSIAAALSSTLIALTAVRRISPRKYEVTALPDEAAAYLFGPLVSAIKKEASESVAAAMTASNHKPKPSSEAEPAQA